MFDHLETERLLLRRFQPSDAADCFDFLSDRETCRLDGGYEPFPEMNGDFRSLMDKWQENDDSRRMIVLKSENKVVGTLHFMPDRRRCVQTRELGFVLSPN